MEIDQHPGHSPELDTLAKMLLDKWTELLLPPNRTSNMPKYFTLEELESLEYAYREGNAGAFDDAREKIAAELRRLWEIERSLNETQPFPDMSGSVKS